MLHRILVLVLLICLWNPSDLRAQGGDEVAFLALTKSLEWNELIKSHELEINISYVKKTEPNSELEKPGVLKNDRQMYYEKAQIIKSVYDSKSNAFTIVICQGNSSISLSASKDETQGEDNSLNYFGLGSNGTVRVFGLDGNEFELGLKKVGIKPFDLIDISLENSMGLQSYPVRFVHDCEGKEGPITAAIVNFLSSADAAANVSLSEDKDSSGKAIKTVRFKVKYNEKSVAAYRFVISNEGFDKGLLLEIHEGYVAKNHFGTKYEDESILDQKILCSAVVKWVQAEDASSQKTLVVPETVKKRSEFNFSRVNSTEETASFKWKFPSSFDDNTFSREKAKEMALRYRQQIDRKFNR